MALTYYERKERLPHGAVSRVAEELGRPVSTVSRVLAGTLRDREVETRLAQLMREPTTAQRVSVNEAFGSPARTLRRSHAVSA